MSKGGSARCDTCGGKFRIDIPGRRYCSDVCTPKFEMCKCERPIDDDGDCLRCGRSLTPADPRALVAR